MSTRSVIAIPAGEPEFMGAHLPDLKGVYVHFDGYPSGVGATLWKLFHNTEDPKKLTETLLRVSGWSSICNWDGKEENIVSFDMKESKYKDMFIDDYNSLWEWSKNKAVYYNGERADNKFWNKAQILDSWCEYLYEIYDYHIAIYTITNNEFHLIGQFKFTDPEPDWGKMEELANES